MDILTRSKLRFATNVYVLASIEKNDHDGLHDTYAYIPYKGYTSLKLAQYHAQEDWRRQNFDKSEGLEFKWRHDDEIDGDVLSYSYLKQEKTPDHVNPSASGLVVITYSKTEMVRTAEEDICCILEIPILSARIVDTEELT